MNGTYYPDYLELDKLLGAQKPLSEHHDEMLFILVHQAFELWFKQIHHEIDSIKDLFAHIPLHEREMGVISQRIDRIVQIQKLFGPQLDILETMTPMDFLEFRHLLAPASGFQSVQHRMLEVSLGLVQSKKAKVDTPFFMGRLSTEHQELIKEELKRPSLFSLVEDWLERVPFLEHEAFNFWEEYQKAVFKGLEEERKALTNFEGPKEAALADLDSSARIFDALFDKEKYEGLLRDGQRVLSQKATLGALFILLYRHEPILSLPFQVLTSLMNMDQGLTAWRHRHALLAQRMLGTKMGTGGSSGHQYLKKVAEKNQIFLDLFNLSTFLIPKGKLPKLPEELLRHLNFLSRGQI